MRNRFNYYRLCPICGKRHINRRRINKTNTKICNEVNNNTETGFPESGILPEECIQFNENKNETIFTHDATYCKGEENNTVPFNCDEVGKFSVVSEFIIEKFEAVLKSVLEHQQKKQCTDETGLHGRGLFHYRQWWERNQADISVNGELLSGVPIFTDKNTLRVVNDKYSYFIPLEKIDYIRTDDGLREACRSDDFV